MELDHIITGDAVEILPTLPDESIDLLATDPPYGLAFMGKDWDRAVPSIDVWRECLRVLKPGAFAFILCTPRQDCLNHMIVNLESAGFDCGFTSIYWTYASGFPKAMNISKAVDKKLGLERKVIGKRQPFGRENRSWQGRSDSEDYAMQGGWKKSEQSKEGVDITEPASEQAKLLDGSYGGFQPKPAVEVILVAMKPLSERTYIDQALKSQKGVTWLDDARMPFQDSQDNEGTKRVQFLQDNRGGNFLNAETSKRRRTDLGKIVQHSDKGRFPANLLCSDDTLNDGAIEKGVGHVPKRRWGQDTGVYGKYGEVVENESHLNDVGSFSRYFDLDRWFEKQLAALPESVRRTFPFLIVPKASKSERDQGLESLPLGEVKTHGEQMPDVNGGSHNTTGQHPATKRNVHPTVKPLKLMSYLVTLGSRPNDVILDPFIGSGTTAIATRMLKRHFLGIEINSEYVKIAEERLRPYMDQSVLA